MGTKWSPDWRPVSDQEVADAHDTAEYVLAYAVRSYTGNQHIKVTVTGMRPSSYVPFEGPGGGLAHWRYPDQRWYWYRHAGALGMEDLFAFELTRDFTRLPDEDVARKLDRIASAARIAGADDVVIDHDRRVVTGTYLYLPDHPDVQYVRATGYYPYVTGPNRTPVPATTKPYGR